MRLQMSQTGICSWNVLAQDPTSRSLLEHCQHRKGPQQHQQAGLQQGGDYMHPRADCTAEIAFHVAQKHPAPFQTESLLSNITCTVNKELLQECIGSSNALAAGSFLSRSMRNVLVLVMCEFMLISVLRCTSNL